MARKQIKAKNKSVEIALGEANEKQRLFYASRSLYTAYGGARGGGKSHAVRVKAILGALRWDGIKILIIRRTYPELQNSIIDEMLKIISEDIAVYNGTQRMLFFANGSTIKFGHYQGDSSSMEYQGQQYDWIFMDEATHFTEDEFRILGGCLRGVNNIPKRFYLTCNPGGVGHNWVKRLFITRDFKKYPQNPEADENPDDYTFIFAKAEDNTALMNSPNGKGYLQMLANLPEHTREAWRYGNWDAVSGQFFAEFRRDKHVIPPLAVPKDWARYRAFDYGLDMLACYWIAVDFHGRSYVYRELKRSNLIVSDAASEIKALTLPSEQIAVTFAPPDIWSRTKDTGKTMAEEFARNGVGLVRASSARAQGWMQLKELFKDWPDGKPGMLITTDCPGLIGDLECIQVADDNPNDCAKTPHSVTHSPDAIRYFAHSRSLPAIEQNEDMPDEDEAEDYDSYMTGGELNHAYLAY